MPPWSPSTSFPDGGRRHIARGMYLPELTELRASTPV